MPSKAALKKVANNAYVKRRDRQRTSKALDDQLKIVHDENDKARLELMVGILRSAPKARFRGNAVVGCEKLWNKHGKHVLHLPHVIARRREDKRIRHLQQLEADEHLNSGHAGPPPERTREEWLERVKTSEVCQGNVHKFFSQEMMVAKF